MFYGSCAKLMCNLILYMNTQYKRKQWYQISTCKCDNNDSDDYLDKKVNSSHNLLYIGLGLLIITLLTKKK